MQLTKTEEMSPKVKTPNSKKGGNPNKKAKLQQTPNKPAAKANSSPSISKSEKKNRRRQRLKEAAAAAGIQSKSPVTKQNQNQKQGNKQKGKKDQKNGVQNQTHTPSKEVNITFPLGFSCCKDVLLKIINIADKIRSPRVLNLEFSSTDEAIAKSELLRQLKLNGENLMVQFSVNPHESDPLKRVAYVANVAMLDSVKKFFNAIEVEPLRSRRKRKGPIIMHVLTFKSAADAEAATNKKMTVENGAPIILRPFYNRQKNNESKTKEPGSLKRKLDETEPATNKKKQQQQQKVTPTKQEDDDDEEDEEEEDDEEEDDDEQEMEDDDEEEEDDDDDDDDDDDE